MKKLLLSLIAVIAVLAVYALPVNAAKPSDNNAGAQTYGWYLSGAVMPVPPYGSADIIGSDTASKLIVNRPNGKVTTNLTGIMNGLHANTTYTVYLTNFYIPYVSANVAGVNEFDFEWLGSHYVHSANLSQTGLEVTGDGGYPSGGPFSYAWTITSGSVVDNHLHLVMDYTLGASCTMTMDGNIAGDGSMSGTWTDNCDGTRTSTWTSAAGLATQTSGNTGWTGQLVGTLPFTFMTDNLGSGSWHYNFKSPVPAFSVWINEAGTMLISDSIAF